MYFSQEGYEESQFGGVGEGALEELCITGMELFVTLRWAG